MTMTGVGAALNSSTIVLCIVSDSSVSVRPGSQAVWAKQRCTTIYAVRFNLRPRQPSLANTAVGFISMSRRWTSGGHEPLHGLAYLGSLQVLSSSHVHRGKDKRLTRLGDFHIELMGSSVAEQLRPAKSVEQFWVRTQHTAWAANKSIEKSNGPAQGGRRPSVSVALACLASWVE